MATLVLGNRNYSSWSLRGWLLVRQAGLAAEEIVIPLRTPETAPQIRRHSPSGKVPALVDGAVTVWDSLAIAEYCAEQAGFQALRGAWPMNLKRVGQALAPTPEVAADIARITALWADCRTRFGADGPFLFGDWCAADAMYAPVVTRFVSYAAPLDPQATAYCNAVMNHPLMREWSEQAAGESWAISDIDGL